jgi:hypothetical protein
MCNGVPRRRGSWLAVMTALLVCFIAPTATADAENRDNPRLLLFSDQLEDALVARVLGELRSQGFEVVPISAATASMPDREVLAIAEAAGAVAAVGISVSESAVDLRVTDCMTEATFVRRLEVAGDPAVAALRTVEVLRTRLINLLALAPRRKPRAAEPTRPAAPPERVRAPPPRSELGVALGGAVAESPGGSRASWHLLAAFRWRTPTDLLLEAFALLPVSQAEFREREGSALLGFGCLGAGVGWRPIRQRWWSPDLGAGLAGTLVHVRGIPGAGLAGHTDTSLAASPYLRIGFGAALWRTLALRGDLLTLLAMPRTVILFGDRPVGAWGRPVVLGSAGLEWSWQ